MMKILIADDDVLIRKWLGLLLQQAGQQAIQVYQAENGKEALNIIRDEMIDLLITDIKMPIMDGIDLIKAVKAFSPNPRIVVLSAYDDYNYVRETLKNGAFDYLLKVEMDLKDIQAILHTVEQDMFLEDALEKDDREELVKECLPNAEMFRRFWEDEQVRAETFFNQISISLNRNALLVSMLHIKGDQEAKISHSKIIIIISRILKGKNIRNIVVPYFNDNFIIIYNSREKVFEKQKQENGLLMTYLEAGLQKYVNCKMQYSINVRLNDPEELRSKVKEAEQMLARKQYYQDENVQIRRNLEKEEEFVMRFKEQVKAALDSNRLTQAENITEVFIEKSHEEFVNPKILLAGCIGIAYHFLNYITVVTGKDNISLAEEIMEQLLKIETAEELELYFTRLRQRMETILTVEDQKKYSLAVEKGMLYIEEWCTEKISLEDVAKAVYLNKNYFSELFKKEVGMNYNEYLNEARIRKACVLITEGNYALSEIAQMTGFSDQNYFAKIFKKVAGQTPMEYKKGNYLT